MYKYMIRLIRHAESTWNSIGDKSRDVSLSTNGKKQASMLEGEFDVVVCSTLKRARETLDNSKIIYKNILFTDLCRECLTGNEPDYYNNEPIRIETENELLDRINKFNILLKKYQEQNQSICVITHHGFLYKITGYEFKNAYWFDHYIVE